MIYAKTWTPDEEILSDSLNKMAADIGNSTDNIHPQYAPSAGLVNYLGFDMAMILGNDPSIGYKPSFGIRGQQTDPAYIQAVPPATPPVLPYSYTVQYGSNMLVNLLPPDGMAIYYAERISVPAGFSSMHITGQYSFNSVHSSSLQNGALSLVFNGVEHAIYSVTANTSGFVNINTTLDISSSTKKGVYLKFLTNPGLGTVALITTHILRDLVINVN